MVEDAARLDREIHPIGIHLGLLRLAIRRRRAVLHHLHCAHRANVVEHILRPKAQICPVSLCFRRLLARGLYMHFAGEHARLHLVVGSDLEITLCRLQVRWGIADGIASHVPHGQQAVSGVVGT